MESYIQIGIINSINGKNPNKVIKSSKQFKKVVDPFLFNGIIIDAKTLEGCKCYDDTTDGRRYLTGSNIAFEIELSNIN